MIHDIQLYSIYFAFLLFRMHEGLCVCLPQFLFFLFFLSFLVSPPFVSFLSHVQLHWHIVLYPQVGDLYSSLYNVSFVLFANGAVAAWLSAHLRDPGYLPSVVNYSQDPV